jgi:Uma2 family endonuclease
MSGMAVAQRMTVAEFLEMDTPRWTTLVEGEVVLHAPRNRHQRVVGDLLFALEMWRRAKPGRGEVWMPLGIALDDHNYYEPDLLWYSERRKRGRTDETLHPLPDIAVEVRSPSTWRYDIGVKKSRYEQHGLPELWLVDTAADEVIVFRRSQPNAPTFDVSLELARGDALTSPLLPAFAFALDELFGPPAP